MKVLVTGNLGYIGPVLSAALSRSGHEVHGYDSALFVRFAMTPLPRLARQTVADIRDTAELSGAIDRCDAVVHLAAMSNDPLGELDPTHTREINLDATLRLIGLCDRRPLILYSSASVYGVSDAPCTEEHPVRPLTLYSELKVAAEREALRARRSLVFRNGTVHGPAPVLRGDLLLNSMVASALTTGEIVVMTTPSTMRPVVDVRDLAALTVGALERSMTGLYNVASVNVSVGAAAALVARLTDARIVERHEGADPRDYAMDTARLAAAAGWWRPTALEDSIRDLVAYYRETGLTAHDVATRRFHRIAQFRSRVVSAAAAIP